MKKEIGMLAGGTGLTPMLQVIKEIIQNPDDHTQVHFLFANQTDEDILLKEELDWIAKNHSNIKITYVVTTTTTTTTTTEGKMWSGGYTGMITQEMIAKHLPTPSKDHWILVCGPPGFMEAISGKKTPDYQQGPVKGHLKALGYTDEMVFKF